MTQQIPEKVEREQKPSLLERFGRYLMGMEGRRINCSLRELGFFRTHDRTDDASLQKFIAERYEDYNSGFLTELYIAPGVLFGETEKKYVVYMRDMTCRERQIEKGGKI